MSKVDWHADQPDFEMRPEPKIKTYTGQMTADQLRNTKIRIESVDHGKAFREMVDIVFAADNGTYANTRNFDSKPFYFCDAEGYLSHKYQNFDYFNSHQYTEIKWQPAVSDEPTPEEEEAFEIMSRNGGSIGDFEFNNGDKVLVYRKCEWVEGQYVGSLNNVHNQHVCDTERDGALVFRAKDIKRPGSDQDEWVEKAEVYISGYATCEGSAKAVYNAMVSGKLPIPEVKK